MKSGADLSGEMPSTFGLVVVTVVAALVCIGIGYLGLLALELLWHLLLKIV